MMTGAPIADPLGSVCNNILSCLILFSQGYVPNLPFLLTISTETRDELYDDAKCPKDELEMQKKNLISFEFQAGGQQREDGKSEQAVSCSTGKWPGDPSEAPSLVLASVH
jgi:hypothetical protein